MSDVLSQITAPDNYTSGSTIQGYPIDAVTIDVVNQAIYWQLKRASAGAQAYWEGIETPMIPGSRTIKGGPGEIVGVRIRAVIPSAQLPVGNTQAIVTVRTDP